jgi:hypothetical protein
LNRPISGPNASTAPSPRAPRLIHEAEADQWYADGVTFGAIGINQQAGVRFETPEALTLQGRMATVPRGGYDPQAHVQDMDRDTVAGGVLYPSQALTTYRIPDSALLSAIFRAYNDWLADFCQPYPQRLKGIAMLNVDDVQDAVGELQRAAKLGLAGGLIPLRPLEHRYDHPRYEPLWAAAQDLAMPFSLHTGTRRWRPGADGADPTLVDIVERTNKEHDVRIALAAMILGGSSSAIPGSRSAPSSSRWRGCPIFWPAWIICTRSKPSASTGDGSRGVPCPAISSGSIAL